MKKKLLVAVAMLMTLGGVSRAQVEYTQGVAFDQVTTGKEYSYFLYNLGAKKFLTEGMDYGTRATVDNAGRVIRFDKNDDSSYKLYTRTFADPDDSKHGYVGVEGDNSDLCYLDKAAEDAGKKIYFAKLSFETVEVNGYGNVYKIKNQNGAYLVYDKETAIVKHGASTEDVYSYWIIVPTEARKTVGDYTYYLQNTDNNRYNGKNDRYIWEYTSSDRFKINGTCNGVSNRNAEYWNLTPFDISQTMPIKEGVPGLPDGIYKLMCQGFYRPGDDGVTDKETKNAMLYLNESTSPIMNINEEASQSNGNGFTVTVDGIGYVPKSQDNAAEVFLAGHYNTNEVIGVVKDQNLTIGIKKETGIAKDWTVFDNFRLTYLGPTTVNRTTATGKFGTICLPFEADVTDATLYTITNVDKNGTITLQQVSTAEAGVPYIYQATAGNQTFTDKATQYAGAPKEDAYGLTGAFFTTDVPVGSYVMQTQGETQGFYKVASGDKVQCGANKCYLTLDAPVEVKALFFAMDDATAITTAEDAKRGDAQVHDLNGRPQPRLQKGVNIVNGKKIVVK